jgi:hypothetical protein
MLKETGQDRVRELLASITGYIPNETLAGAVFAVALIMSEYLFSLNLKGSNA